MQLLHTPDNPIPPGAEVSAVRTSDALALRAARWPRSGTRDRGTAVLLQGRAEFIEKYFEVVGELRERGFAVVAFDWRGQGGSDRLLPDPHRGHVRHFNEFRLDYEAVRRELCPRGDGEVLVLAHSMGGCIALSAAHDGWLDADRLVASSPMLGLSLVKHTRLARGLARSLALLGLRARMVPGGRTESISTLPYEGNRLSTDQKRYARNAALATALGSGAIGSPSIGWLLAAYEAMDALAKPGPRPHLRTPTLIVAAGDDPICSTPAAELFARSVPDVRLVVVPGARHEVLMETDPVRAAFWEAFDAFVGNEAAPAFRA